MRSGSQKSIDWSGRLETLEERVVMSADPLGGLLGGQVQHHSFRDEMPAIEHHIAADQPAAIEHHLNNVDELPPIGHHRQSEADFWIDYSNLEAIEEEIGRIEQTLADAHDQSGLAQVRSDYGFDGTGQTVAVIDSGIAYDHFALGGGLGSNYRVVGGWDFTGENDADPYDDGPGGSHGTHVSGIIGASGGNHEGVAPGVDLVGLRVFDDAGDGFFSWVEDALQWVYDNRDSFENPITAVNLSLGVTGWNSDSIPAWATLENEFNLLKQAGIFISVSAGNSFTSHNTPGLSYPASSPHVVPVASVDDSGLLSYFSQRNASVIAAPGRGIISTVPDYTGNNNGTTDDYASFSGTSMAAPYVAGASVIIREAMEFVGYTNITQQTIYDHMIATADSFYDSATNANYNRLNLEAAIDALMPTDDYGSTVATAHNLGSLSESTSLSGVISTLDDVDQFKFTASGTGTVTFTASGMTHNLDADWEVSGGTGTWSGANNEVFTLDVIAGQEYTVGFSSDNGLGYYDLDITAESSFTYTDWGSISFAQNNGISVAGEAWYRISAANSGYVTTEAMFNAGGGQINLELYNSSMQLIGTGNPSGGLSRIDYSANANDELFLKVIGTNSDVDFRLANLVSVNGTTVEVAGTAGDDAFSFAAGGQHQISVNGVSYNFDPVAVNSFEFQGGTGNDTVTLTGTGADESAVLQSASSSLSGNGYVVSAFNSENVTINGGGGSDVAQFHDTVGDDTFDAYHDYAVLSGEGFSNRANGFERTFAYAYGGGNDTANFYDSAGEDSLYAYPDVVVLTGTGFYNYARAFESTNAYAINGGNDAVAFFDSAGDDDYRAYHDHAVMSGSGFRNTAYSFERTYAYSNNGGNDIAQFQDSAGDDTLNLYANSALITGDGFYNYISGFARTYAYAYGGGHDVANFFDSGGDDVFYGLSDVASMSGSGFYNYARGFEATNAFASNGGNDTAVIYDSAGDDDYRAYQTHVVMTGSNFRVQATSFDQTYAHAINGGNDIAQFQDSAGDDVFNAYHNRATLSGNGFYNFTGGFERTYAYAYNGGNDVANMYDSSGDDRYYAYPEVVAMVGDNFYNYARSFEQTNAYANNGGNDIAYYIDSAGDDHFQADESQATMSGIGYSNRGHGFEQNFAYGNNGGNDTLDLYDTDNDDLLTVRDLAVTLTSTGLRTSAYGFEQANLHSQNGGTDTTDIDVTDYAFSLIGDWA